MKGKQIGHKYNCNFQLSDMYFVGHNWVLQYFQLLLLSRHVQ